MKDSSIVAMLLLITIPVSHIELRGRSVKAALKKSVNGSAFLDGEAKFVFPYIRCQLFFRDRYAVIAVVFFVGLERDFCIGMQKLDFYFYHIVFL